MKQNRNHLKIRNKRWGVIIREYLFLENHLLNRYLIYEYLKDNNDNRWKLLLDFILVPDGVNQEGCDIDFTQVDFEEFFYFMLSIKS